MAIDLPALASLVVATAALAGAGVSYAAARDAKFRLKTQAEAAETKVELEAFEVAKELWRTTIGDLKQELEAAKRELASARAALTDELNDRRFLEQRVTELEHTVNRLRQKLRELGVNEFDPSEMHDGKSYKTGDTTKESEE